MNFKDSNWENCKILLLAVATGFSFLLCLAMKQAVAGPSYQIDGFYLGATPDQLGVALQIDPLLDEKFYDTNEGGFIPISFVAKGTCGSIESLRKKQ